MNRTVLAMLLAWGCCLPGAAVCADVVELKSGGRVEGDVTPPENEEGHYLVYLEGGGTLRLQHRQVRRVHYDVPPARQYAEMTLKHVDTAADQWKLAKWCQENGLEQQFRRHCQRVIELDTNHPLARQGLGHRFLDGRWTTREGHLADKGLIRHDGRWMTQQQAALLVVGEQSTQEQIDWKTKLQRWRAQLDSGRPGREEVDFSKIQDPKAVPAIVDLLGKERRSVLIATYIDTLGNIGSPSAVNFLLKNAIFQNNVDIRERCLRQLLRHRRPEMVGEVAEYLHHYDNPIINRAAVVLAKLDYPSAVVPLAGALNTRHLNRDSGSRTYFYSQEGPYTHFDTKGPKASYTKLTIDELLAKGKGTYHTLWVQNQDVYSALRLLSGGEDFGFDGDGWRFWYQQLQEQQKTRTPTIRLSRDE